MTRPRAAACCFGLALLATAAVAASHANPVEATVPSDQTVPGAERVEAVLRARYVMPELRGRALAEFLTLYAAPGIDVRAEPDGLTVVAPADAQRALGTFIHKCLRHGIDELLPTPARGFERPRDFRLGPTPDPIGAGGTVPTYEDPSAEDFKATPVRKKPSRNGDSPFYQSGPDDGFPTPPASGPSPDYGE